MASIDIHGLTSTSELSQTNVQSDICTYMLLINGPISIRTISETRMQREIRNYMYTYNVYNMYAIEH